jgi:hypothetical protein
MKKLPILFFLLWFTTARTQSLYEIKFTGQNPQTKYSCLLVYYNENDSYMRIGYLNAANQYRVVEVKYKGTSGKYNDGRSYFSLTGSSPRFITTSTQGESYNPDYFVWIGTEILPYTTDTLTSTTGQLTVYRVDSYKKLEVTDLTTTYLRTFYGENENDYVALSKMASDHLVKKVSNNSSATTLHLIVMANTIISDVGPGCSIDLLHLDNEFRAISNTLNISYDPHFISGYSFAKANLLNTLNNLSVGNSDIVIFVYRGHGFRWSNQTSSYPSLALMTSHSIPPTTDNTILLETVYDQIVAKGGRLNIVLGDCCNSDIGVNQWTTDNYLYQQSNSAAEYVKLNSLFMERQGNLLFAASEKGEVSWTNSNFGGFFTSSFIQALDEEISYLRTSESSWKNVITNTGQYAIYKSTNCSNCKIQHAISYNQITKR